jgi:hypothetical protein
MAARLIKHGTNAGYNAEIQIDNICDRCRAAHRVYARQYTKIGRAEGLKYSSFDVIDQLDESGRHGPSRRRADTSSGSSRASDRHLGSVPPNGAVPLAPDTTATPDGSNGPTLADRLGSALKDAFVPSNEYVETGESPDYITVSEPDPEPAGDWSQTDDQEAYIINKAGMALIENNLGTYLSVLGITLEMIDPYCGPILAEHFDNIVGRWSKVIARYPAAAKIFMSKDGGTIMVWIGALQATWPVLIAVYDHHLAKTVQTDSQGRVFKVRNRDSKDSPLTDATTPPMPEYDYSVG